ncbi:MAG TPA: ABC transporter permease [Actinomycetota bacterium]|jgi:simple sugar transport system permease protein|nr:ABC transporter permease [Actinomycetota bacterium]
MDLGDIGAAVRIALTYFTLLYLTGLGGLFSERSGIVNIGLEGLMWIGTVTGAAGVAMFAGPPPDGLGWGAGGVVLGLLFGALCGAMFASIHAVATINFRVDHIVSGVVINLVAIGLARFLSFIFFEQATQSDPGGPHLARLDLPLVSDIPGGLGAAFSNLSPMVIFAALLVIPVSFALYRTRWGLRLRSAGENPEATRSLGVAVAPLRWEGVLLSGALAGLSGAYLAVEVVGNWREGQTLGLGFIALAALILSNWNPKRLMVVAFLFGFALAIPLRLADAPIIRALPPQFINMIPFVVTIVAIAGFVGRVRPPAAAGRAYEGAGGS